MKQFQMQVWLISVFVLYLLNRDIYQDVKYKFTFEPCQHILFGMFLW